MSSYIIAGSADSIDTAYCEQIAKRIKSKYKNIDFRIVIKHPSEWEEYLQQICRIYGFLKKSNPIIYTFDGKIIGNKEAFMSATAKYFGLDESALVVHNLTNQVNMKIATQQLNLNNIKKGNIKTLSEKIDCVYQQLLKKNVIKHELKERKQFLTNGIEYMHCQLKGVVQPMSFAKNKEVKVQIEEIAASDIDLMAISLNDQIKVEEQIPSQLTGKDAFVTANQKNNSDHDKMSEASRTNKMHQSSASCDKDSKHMKESSKSKLRIDEQNDDVPDYVDQDMSETKITELADNFHIAFLKNAMITGQMIFYHNEDPQRSILRAYNDNRPVIGHRVLIKQVHYDGQIENQFDNNVNAEANVTSQEQLNKSTEKGGAQKEKENVEEPKVQDKVEAKVQNNVQTKTEENAETKGQSKKEANQQTKQQNKNEKIAQPKQQNATQKKIEPQKELPKSIKQVQTKQNNQGGDKPKNKIQISKQKIRTQPNITEANKLVSHNDILHEDDAFSQVNSDLNLVSNLNYHTLYIEKPLSGLEIKNLIYFIKQTDCIGCLQFLGQNPNPRVKMYSRTILLKKDYSQDLSLPVQRFIEKQLQDEQFVSIQVPNQKCFQYELVKDQPKFELLQINQLGFEHYIYKLPEEINEEQVLKVLKYTLDSILSLEDELKKDIGYNIVFTRKMIMLVPLAEPYQIYGNTKLYFDGLAYLGLIHTAQLIKKYQLQKEKIDSMGKYLRNKLSYCSNGKQ